jgi:ketosteroid isomerase-like protein
VEVEMPEEKLAGIMREYEKAKADMDLEKAFSYLTDDVVLVTPNGTFKNKAAIKSFLTAMDKYMKDTKVTETGNGIIVQGDKAFYEHVVSGTYQGKKYELLAMSAYEFKGDKIKAVRDVGDRLLVAQQTAKGWLAKTLINMIIKQMEKSMK